MVQNKGTFSATQWSMNASPSRHIFISLSLSHLGICPKHQSDSSWVGYSNGCSDALFPRVPALPKSEQGVQKVYAPACGVLFSIEEGPGEGLLRVSSINQHLVIIFTSPFWVQNGPDFLIFVAHECVCVHVCVHACTCTCEPLGFALFSVNFYGYRPPTSMPSSTVKSPWLPLGESFSLTFSPEVVTWPRSSLPSSCLPWLVQGWAHDILQAKENSLGTFDGTTGEKMFLFLLRLLI